MKLSQLTRITEEDFAQEDLELIQKLARSLNPFLEQVSQAMSKNIDFDNLNQEVLTFTLKVDALGKPLTTSQIRHSLKTRPKGLVCVSARNLTNPTTYPTGTPFVSFSFSGSDYSVLTINAISGLPANMDFELTLIVIG